jgi:hypothetical protein
MPRTVPPLAPLDAATRKWRGFDTEVLKATYIESGEAESQGPASKAHTVIFEETMRGDHAARGD